MKNLIVVSTILVSVSIIACETRQPITVNASAPTYVEPPKNNPENGHGFGLMQVNPQTGLMEDVFDNALHPKTLPEINKPKTKKEIQDKRIENLSNNICTVLRRADVCGQIIKSNVEMMKQTHLYNKHEVDTCIDIYASNLGVAYKMEKVFLKTTGKHYKHASCVGLSPLLSEDSIKGKL